MLVLIHIIYIYIYTRVLNGHNIYHRHCSYYIDFIKDYVFTILNIIGFDNYIVVVFYELSILKSIIIYYIAYNFVILRL